MTITQFNKKQKNNNIHFNFKTGDMQNSKFIDGVREQLTQLQQANFQMS